MSKPPPSALSHQQADLLRALAYSYLRHGQPARAAVLWAGLHALWPADVLITKSLACAQLRCGKPEQALSLLDGLLDDGVADDITHLLRGQALARIGRLAEAARSMRFFVAARAELHQRKDT